MSLFTRFVLPALAAAGTAAAASCSVSATTTLQSQGDATALASCKTFSGSIALSTDTSEPIAISGLQVVDGDFVVKNVTQLTQLTFTDLTEVTGTLDFEDDTRLSVFTAPKLTKVNSILWLGLPALQGITANITECADLNIQNTQLGALDGISLETVDTFFYVNNPYTTNISMQLKSITKAFTAGENSASLSIQLPQLTNAYNMTFRKVEDIDLSALQTLNDSLSFLECGITGFEADNLTLVGGALVFSKNEALANITLPALTKIGGGFQVGNNSALEGLSFPALKTVVGALDFTGNFTSVSMPKLADAQGAFNIQSTGDITSDCAVFLANKGGAIKGKPVCAGKQVSPGGAGTTPTSTAGGATKTGGAGQIVYSMHALTFSGLVAAFFGLV